MSTNRDAVADNRIGLPEMLRRLLPLTVALVLALPAAAATADSRLESSFQDDARILGTSKAIRGATLDEVKSLGVQRVRLTVLWSRFAPHPQSATVPVGFNPRDPNAYPAANWTVLDDAIRAIRKRGMQVSLNPTAPAPRWAVSGFYNPAVDDVTNPDPAAFEAFMTALGTRYDGRFVPAGQTVRLPRVDSWSIWNEPNQGAWLAPQWQTVGKGAIAASPQRYRALAGAAWNGLAATGHRPGRDTILLGETAPKGFYPSSQVTGMSNAMPPLKFLRQVYCLDDSLVLLKGAAATRVDCPATPNPAAFVAQNPALFRLSGYAHHPYELTFSPTTVSDQPQQYVTMANLGLLTDQLGRIMGRYAVKRSSIPLYLTNYGYQTNPPDSLAVRPDQQAAYINQAEYIAWKNPRVKTLTQSLLVDEGPVAGATGQAKWASFQTGLRYGPGSGRSGKAKPALDAYRIALFLPRREVGKKHRLRLWGHVRPGSSVRKVDVQVRVGKHGRFVHDRQLKTNRYGYLNQSIPVERSGAVRLRWRSGHRTFTSRVSAFRVAKAA